MAETTIFPPAPAFAELGARSNFTLLDGASHPHELVGRAKVLGHAGIGICDTNSLAGAVRAHVAAKEVGLPYVLGTRLVLEDGACFLVWPTDRASYGRLTRLLSSGRMDGPKGTCRIGREAMLAHASGWVMAAVPPLVPDEGFEARLGADAAALHGMLALPLFCMAPALMDGLDQARLERLMRLGVKLLATTDPRYHARERRRLADVLSAIRLHTLVDALGLESEANSERCLKPLEEMGDLFAACPSALSNTLVVVEACSGFSLDMLRHEYPHEVLEPGRTAQQTLTDRVRQAAEARWADRVPEKITAGIAHELALIEQLDYAPYFLTVHEIVKFAVGQGILCQGRGSAANSTVCYVLGITSVDPSKHELLFERFVSANRNEPPDIDVDFEHQRREEVIQHIYDRYGRDRAAIVGTVIRYRGRSAIREVGKAMGLSEDITTRLAKSGFGLGGERSFENLAEKEGFDPADRRLLPTLELAEEIQNFPRHLATHVGGFVMSRGPLTDMAVIGSAAMKDRTVLEWDKDDIDALKLLKVDVLGLGMLSCLKRGFDLLRRHRGKDWGLRDVPLDCLDTYAMLRRADSLGVFQVESRAQMSMLPRLRPETFYDLVVEVAIVRPGPIQGDMVHPYLRRKWGVEEVVYPQPGRAHGPPDELKQVLGRTLGVPLFQEQAMRLAIVAAGFTAGEADDLRRSMATFKMTGGVSAYRERLIGGMVRRGYQPDMAERVFKQIEGFGSYGFPESHAASFAQLAYISSYIKCHHPGVFAAALLNSQPMGFYAPAQIVRDAAEHGVGIRPIDVNASDWDCSLEPEQSSKDGYALRLGLRMVSGLSEADGQAVVDAREAGNGSPFESVEELARRAAIGRKALEALAAADAFSGMKLSRRAALWGAKAIEDDDLPLLRSMPLIGEQPLIQEPAVALPEQTAGQSVVQDYASVGLTLRSHPLGLLRPALRAEGYDDTRRLHTIRAKGFVRIPGIVLMRQRPGTAKGVIFVTLEDEFGIANLVVYKHVIDRYRRALVGSKLMLAEGHVERLVENAEVPITHLICRRLVDRSDLLAGLNTPDVDWADRILGRADEGRRPDPGVRAEKLSFPASRDFR
jgi:error-prone DNA polymerase